VHLHGIAVHGLAHQDVVVVVVAENGLHSSGSLALPLLSLLSVHALGGLLVELLEVTCRANILINCVDMTTKKEDGRKIAVMELGEGG